MTKTAAITLAAGAAIFRVVSIKDVRTVRTGNENESEWSNGTVIFRSDRSDREKRTTSKGGPVFLKLFQLDRTDPLSFGPKFPEILVEWIVPIVKTDLRSQIFLLVDEKAIQSLSNITFVSNDFTLLG